MARVADRVAQGGNHIQEPVVRRRFGAGITNFHGLHKPQVNAWRPYDNSKEQADLIESSDLP